MLCKLPKYWAEMTVLRLVEDQEDNRRILRDLLGNAGYQLVEAESGEEALVAVDAQRPDLILMDIQLPVMDGYEAARRIKSNPDMKAVPIIAVASYPPSSSGDASPPGSRRRRGARDYHGRAPTSQP